MMIIIENQEELVRQAARAIHERTFYAAYPEHPKAYEDGAQALAEKWFENQLNNSFTELLQTGADNMKGVEISPYTQQKLNIIYPTFSVENLVSNAAEALEKWRYAIVEDRARLLIASLEKIKSRFFDIALATMHTTGQSFLMSFQASGPHANDRALEAITLAYEELKRFPPAADWEKSMGKFSVKLHKKWSAVSRGIGLVIGCSTFPVWNSVPGIYASLMTGNTVIVKPHPAAVLPIAIVVAEIQKTLQENGFKPSIIQLAADTVQEPITKQLAEHPEVKIIDYTGNSHFGNYIEGLHKKISFTEKAGVNSVILDSVNDMEAVMQNLSFSAALYSGQMCTAPQNFFVPKGGIKGADKDYTFEEVVDKFTQALTALVHNPKIGPSTLGAIQNVDTLDRIISAKDLKNTKIALDSQDVKNPEYPNARIATPIVLVTDAKNKEAYSEELFGPIVFFIKTEDTLESISIARELAIKKGAISCGAYTTDEAVKIVIERQMQEAFTPVSFNLTGPIWMNQNAAFSDFHVTGGNPAGNATFTDIAYVVRRFAWVGSRDKDF